MPIEEYHRREFGLNMLAGGIAGGSAAAVTNSLEAVTVCKQTNPDVLIMEMIKREGTSLFTKGIAARVYYNGV